MAKNLPTYQNYKLQYATEEAQEYTESIFDVVTLALAKLESFMKLIEDGDDEIAAVAGIGLTLLREAVREVEGSFSIVQDHFGLIRVVRYNYWEPNRSTGFAGKIIGVRVLRPTLEDRSWSAVAFTEQL